mgnify:CR=1 FL=1
MTSFSSFEHNRKEQYLEAVPELDSAKASPTPEHSHPAPQSLPTVGQLMRSTSQAIERVYREQIDQRPGSVKCTLLNEKVVVWIEGSMTPLEKLLYQEDEKKAQLLCNTIDKLLYPYLVNAIAQTLGVEVVTLISGTNYANDCTGIIAQLDKCPSVRPSTRKSASQTNRS